MATCARIRMKQCNDGHETGTNQYIVEMNPRFMY